MKFIDEVEITVAAGDGGKGGDVVMVADPGLNTLVEYRFRPRWEAPRGEGGQGSDCNGRKGEDKVLRVPVGAGWHLVDHALALGAVSTLFAMVFRLLPHVRITWRDALTGSAVTTALFALGRFAVTAYLGRKSLGSTFGAAGSVVLLLLWTYYSAQIFFLGAAFIAAHAEHAGRALTPDVDAVAVREDQGPDD